MTEAQDEKFNLPQRLKELTEEKGLSFKYLSVQSGVPLKTIYGWSSGNRPRNLQDLNKVATCLGVSIADFFGSGSGAGKAAESSKWITEWRQVAGLNPAEAANSLGINKNELASYESGRDVPVELLVKLTKLYGMDIKKLTAQIESLYLSL